MAVRTIPGGPSPALRGARLAFLVALLFCILFGYQLVTLFTDWLWFNELGHAEVYRTILKTKVALFLGFGLLFFLFCYTNLWLAQRMNVDRPRPRVFDREREQVREVALSVARWGALGGSILVAFIIAGNSVGHWPEYLQFTHAGRFGTTDPVFHNEIGFYVFRLPFLTYLLNWALLTLAITTVGVAIIHYSDGALDFLANTVPTFAPHVRRHLLALLGTAAALYACTYALSRYDLLYADNNAFYGAGYTDLHARLPAIHLQMACMALTALLCYINIWSGRAFRLPLAGLALWAVVSLVGSGLVPSLVQRFSVVPNQFDREQPYIARDLASTRAAYNLAQVQVQPFSGAGAVTGAALAQDKPTLDNIRLWDWPQLAQVYSSKQRFKQYYRFDLPNGWGGQTGDYNIDVDRYNLSDGYRQVMIGPRELDSSLLQEVAQTWQNRRLQFTHGYGAVVSPVNRVDPEGLPDYLLSQIPPQSGEPALKLDHPQVYFGELDRDYVFVGTRQSEFDYPSPTSSANVETRYTGKAGVRLSSELVKTAWSIRLGDTNMLFSGDLTDQSRILFRRNIRDRVQTLAPFLNLDRDPYSVIYQGRIYWILDCYTLTDRYPYSKPTDAGTVYEDVVEEFNYIRNSVKAVVDSYDGTVTLYVSDPKDPILQTWQRIFPRLFTPIDQMPAGLRAHIRYPEDLFRFQRDIYTNYHVTDALAYYRKDDAWEVPVDPTPSADVQAYSGSSSPRMAPYYVMMRLPGESRTEFLIMTPFQPQNTQNIAGWMCAKCDPEDYGQLVVYRFPKGEAVNGPQQIMNQMKSQPAVSEFQTLNGQQGSKLTFGNLLVIPVEKTLLYVAPVYVQGAGSGAASIPEIKQVIVASGDKVAMRPDLEGAISALIGQAPMGGAAAQATSGAAPGPRGAPPSMSALIRKANDAYQRARQREQEYNKALDDLGKALRDLQTGGK